MDAVGTQRAAREMGPSLSKLVLQERTLGCWSATQNLAHAELRFSTQNVAHGSTGVCSCLGKNKKTDNFATAFTVLLEQ